MDKLFQHDGSLVNHIDYQENNYYEYIANLRINFEYKTEITTLTKARILAVAFKRGDNELVSMLLYDNVNYLLPEIVKACEIMDSSRRIRQLKRKIDFLKGRKAKNSKINRLEVELNSIKNINEGIDISLSGAKAKILRGWVSRVPKEKLEFYALTFPTEMWKRLCDYIHPHPSIFQLGWFQEFVFGKDAPEDSVVAQCKNLTNNDLLGEIVEKYHPDYSFLRLQKQIRLTDTIKDTIVGYTPVDTVLWYWEELRTLNTINIVMPRFKENEPIKLAYGKLMERLMVLQMDNSNSELCNHLLNLAEVQLKKYKLDIDQPVAVLGDASASMQVAVRTSSVITSVLCAVCDAELRVFRDRDEYINNPPRTAVDVIRVSSECRAHSATSPASSLYPYIRDKKIIKTFIVVTDEKENTNYGGEWKYGYSNFNTPFNSLQNLANRNLGNGRFVDLFKIYRKNIYPSKIVFVSFLNNGTKEGQMVRELKNKIPDIEKDLTVFRLDANRPDLSRLDTILNSLAKQSDNFEDLVKEMASEMKKNKINEINEIDTHFETIDLNNDNVDSPKTGSWFGWN